jgi:hypothetical protein
MESEVISFMRGLGTLLLGVGAFGGLLVSLANGRKADRIAAEQRAVVKKIDVIAVKTDVLTDQTNGMSARLEEVARQKGVQEGVARQKREQGSSDCQRR